MLLAACTVSVSFPFCLSEIMSGSFQGASVILGVTHANWDAGLSLMPVIRLRSVFLIRVIRQTRSSHAINCADVARSLHGKCAVPILFNK